MNSYPGDAIDSVGRNASGAVKGLISSIGSGLRGVGSSIQNAVDKPFEQFGLRGSPLRVIDRPIDGVASAAQNFVNRGIIESAEMIGDGVTSGIDEIPKTLTSIGEGRVSFRDRFPKLGLPTFRR